MDNNVYYNIKEKKNKNTDNKNIEGFIDDLVNNLNTEYKKETVNDEMDFINNQSVDDDTISDLVTENNYFANHLNYQDNYTVKMSTKIMDYYGLDNRKLRKNEMIEMILLFESEICNIEIIHKRKQLWFYVNELKNDSFFKQYILVDI